MLALLLAAMAAAMVALVTVPMWRARVSAPPGAEHDMEVYRDQLRDVEQDMARGLLAPDEADAARLEVERRLLTADAARATSGLYAARWRRASALAVAGFVPVAAFGLYLFLGSPGIPSVPFAARTEGVSTANAARQRQGGQPSLDEAIQVLTARLARSPDDLNAWVLLGRARLEQQRYGEAAEAFRRADAFKPDDPDIQFMLAESLIFAAGGVVTPQAAAALERTLAVVGDDPGARFYLALAHMQAGRTQTAFDGWLALAMDTPADAPWLPMLRRNLAAAAAELGLDAERVIPPPAEAPAREPTRAPGPSPEEMAAIREMTPEAQAAMIESMVAQLADRLANEPDYLEGWLRLGRAYRVLGRLAEAREAYGRAAALAPDDPRVAVARRELEALEEGR